MAPPSPANPAAPHRVTLRDVARDVGVSHVAVSLALRDHPRISAGRRREIQAAAARLGYRPDPMLASLSSYRHSRRHPTIRSSIAWLNAWPEPAALRRLREFAAFWRGAEAAAGELGYRLEEFMVDRTLSGSRMQNILLTRGVRGIILPPHQEQLSLAGLSWDEFSVVRLGVSVREPRVHVVSSDHVSCGMLAYQSVRARGYRRVGFVTSYQFDTKTNGNFRSGYLGARDVAAPEATALPPLVLGETDTAADRTLLRRWLRAHRPDVVITSHPQLHRMLQQLDLRVPRDLAVAALSVHDGNFAAGVEQNSEEIGRVALRTLAALIQQNERGVPAHCHRTLIEGRWVDGPSVPIRRDD